MFGKKLQHCIIAIFHCGKKMVSTNRFRTAMCNGVLRIGPNDLLGSILHSIMQLSTLFLLKTTAASIGLCLYISGDFNNFLTSLRSSRFTVLIKASHFEYWPLDCTAAHAIFWLFVLLLDRGCWFHERLPFLLL